VWRSGARLFLAHHGQPVAVRVGDVGAAAAGDVAAVRLDQDRRAGSPPLPSRIRRIRSVSGPYRSRWRCPALGRERDLDLRALLLRPGRGAGAELERLVALVNA
jgi:hypothetical protein